MSPFSSEELMPPSREYLDEGIRSKVRRGGKEEMRGARRYE
jgi:hypothetical protein